MENNELLKHIHEDASMGSFATEKLINELKDKDNKLKPELDLIYKEYLKFKQKSEKLLDKNKADYKDINLMAKMGTFFGVKKEVMDDNSDSSIADMMIKGLSMGSIEMEKKLNNYKEEADKKTLKLAQEFSEFQQDYIIKLKSFL